MDRRNMLAMVSGAGLAAMGARALATEDHEHAAHDMAAMPGHAGHDHAARVTKYAALVAAAGHCVQAANDCVAHCIATLASGDLSMKDCLQTSQDVAAACAALGALASRNAPRLPEFAAACGKICRDCEATCHKQEQHEVCRACGAACADCARECEKLAA